MRSQNGIKCATIERRLLTFLACGWNSDLRVASADCIVECKEVAETENSKGTLGII